MHEKVTAALDFLSARATVKWPFGQLRSALVQSAKNGIEKEARRQVLMASLNGIRRALQQT